MLDDYRKAGGKIEVYGPHAGNRLRFWRNGRLCCASMGSIYRKHLVCFNMLQPGNTTRGVGTCPRCSGRLIPLGPIDDPGEAPHVILPLDLTRRPMMVSDFSSFVYEVIGHVKCSTCSRTFTSVSVK